MRFLFGGFSAAMLMALMGCASTGTPGGGLYDEDPPELRTSNPAYGATNVKDQRIVLRFNENVKLDKITEKMTISPPQGKMPQVLSNAKTVSIELLDTLKANTTYSINLGDAVQDNNEGNPMEELSLLFSTGPYIDSLQLVGHLLNAADLEPITGAYVGIYKVYDGEGAPVMHDTVSVESLADSVLLKYPFERIGKTDAYGAFKIEGCAPGTYRIYGLIDGNGNYTYDLISEDIAFFDQLVKPTSPADSLATDSLLLRSFNEGKVNRYLDETSRPDSNRITLRFAAWMEQQPKFTLLKTDSTGIIADTTLCADTLLIAEPNPTLDTLTYWLTSPALRSLDSLLLAVEYAYTDTAQVDVPRSDTIVFVKPIVHNEEPQDKPKKRGRKRGKGDSEETAADSVKADTLKPVTYMELKMLSQGAIDIGAKPRFEVSAPLDTLYTERFHLQRQQDTLWVDMPIRWVADTLHPRRYTLVAEPHFSPGGNYRLSNDSAAMIDIYGQPLKAGKFTFKEKKPEDYAHLLFNVTGVQGPAYIELLDNKDKPKQRAAVVNGVAKFVHVPAGNYFARLVVDVNGNGKHDAGSLFEHRQPEEVFYFGAPINLRANWEMSQQWDVRETPLLQQKPNDVKVNKPKEQKQKKSKNEEYLRKLGKLP